MKTDWYVLASTQVGNVGILRVVAGPLPFARAREEARIRVTRAPEGYVITMAEFDPIFGMNSAHGERST